jgi:two-component system CheB/CheR fusion protein
MIMDDIEKDDSSSGNRLDDMCARDIRQRLGQPTQSRDFILASELEAKQRKLDLRDEAKRSYQELEHSGEALEFLHYNLLELNRQLQELLEQQKSTGHQLQSLLFSTNVPVLCLDLELRILFFTPAANSLFLIRPTDIGRPLADLQWLAPDPDLLRDAESASSNQAAPDRDVANGQNRWYKRRTEPYRNHRGEIDGVIISYADVTDQYLAVQAQKNTIGQLQQTRLNRTRILRAVSDDLRQPLQTFSFALKLLARDGQEQASSAHIASMEHAVRTMAEALNTMLDVDQIEAGIISFEFENVPVHELLQAVCSEFEFQFEGSSLELKLIRSSAVIHTDQRFFQRIIRSLLANAIRHTDKERVSVGCRRRGDRLRVEVWETGMGAPVAELEDILNDNHNAQAAGRTEPGLKGLGLSIAQRLVDLLGYEMRVSSKAGVGSVFSVEVPLAAIDLLPPIPPATDLCEPASVLLEKQTGEIFIVDDEPDVRTLLELLLSKRGHSVRKAGDLTAALALLGSGRKPPDLLIVDYNLSGPLDGCSLARIMIASMGVKIPVIVLIDDITAETRRTITETGFSPLEKPVRQETLEDEINRLLQHAAPDRSATGPETIVGRSNPRVIIVDDQEKFNEMLATLLISRGYSVTRFSCSTEFLTQLGDLGAGDEPICILLGAYSGSIDGLSILHAINEVIPSARVIMIAGANDVQLATRALKGGAINFFEKPVDFPELISAIDSALESSRTNTLSKQEIVEAAEALSTLTPREQDVLKGILSGRANKNIAADLGISQRTVESHRASVMAKTKCRTLPELVRLAIKAAWPNGSDTCSSLSPNSHR